ncbi:hypothetical protein [Actinomadura rudentiformis]|uniref:Uncharacterized protein n=1 Tax=Actinomadura rudentiformis TaxID=359158 RepID=A0A6H9Z9J3_9ACTN|nr:hypothetical protein [Actinomadura rudentiformis]KAB2352355.1 hypothetical protein F8566_01290 [Actinomadura rudentiformis]
MSFPTPAIGAMTSWLWWVAAAWAAAIMLVGALGVFAPADGDPPVALGVAVAAPPLLVVGLLLRSAPFRAWARAADLRALTLLQMWRVVGFGFLAVWTVDELPGAFALPAGIGDIVVGVTAPAVAARLTRRTRSAMKIFYGWTAFGVIDLIVAVVLGVLHSPTKLGTLAAAGDTTVMSELPMILIPAFIVPAMLALHAISLFNARSLTQSRQVMRGSGR